MNEEKSITEYKEQKGIFQWLKSKFEKLKQRFKTKTEVKKESLNEQELSEADLDKVTGGNSVKTILASKEELMADLGITEPKSWELTEEQLDEVKSEYPNMNPENVQVKEEEQELFEEDLDKITAGYPLNNDEYEK